MKRSTRLFVSIVLTLAAALLAIGIVISQANERRAIDEENDRRFGTVSYTLDELREMVKVLVPEPTFFTLK